jgi:hypothetical protein
VRRVLRSSSGYILTVDEMPAQELAIGDTGRNASLPGVPSFGLKYAFTKSYAKSFKEHIKAQSRIRSSTFVQEKRKQTEVQSLIRNSTFVQKKNTNRSS